MLPFFISLVGVKVKVKLSTSSVRTKLLILIHPINTIFHSITYSLEKMFNKKMEIKKELSKFFEIVGIQLNYLILILLFRYSITEPTFHFLLSNKHHQ